jgi:hypothetical protein
VAKIYISKRKRSPILIIALVTTLSLTVLFGIPIINSLKISSSIEQKSLLAIQQIVGLDLAKYEVNVSSHSINMSSPVSNIFSDYNGSQVEDVSCKLQSNDSDISESKVYQWDLMGGQHLPLQLLAIVSTL